VFVVFGIRHAMHRRQIICGLPDSKYFPHYLINGMILEEKKVIEHTMCSDFV